jgi:hypothetical protein
MSQPLSDEQHKSDQSPAPLHLPRRDGVPPGRWWAVTALLILFIMSSTLLARWLSCRLLPLPAQSPPLRAASPSLVVPMLGAWDSKPCADAPGPLTCDGRLVLAPPDMQIFAHPQGDGACFDKYSVSVTQNIVPTGASPNEVLGKLSLWWFPRCQSHAAEIYWLGDGSARLSVELHVLHPGTGPWQADESYTAVYRSGERTAGVVWTVLVWSPAAAYDVLACGRVRGPGQMGQLCTPKLA